MAFTVNKLSETGASLPDIRRMHRSTIRGDRPFYRPAM